MPVANFREGPAIERHAPYRDEFVGLESVVLDAFAMLFRFALAARVFSL
jgi:hypothetical protein